MDDDIELEPLDDRAVDQANEHIKGLRAVIEKHASIESLLASALWETQASSNLAVAAVMIIDIGQRISEQSTLLGIANVASKSRTILRRLFTRTEEQKTLSAEIKYLNDAVLEIRKLSNTINDLVGRLPKDEGERSRIVFDVKLQIRSLELDVKQLKSDIARIRGEGRLSLAEIRRDYGGTTRSEDRRSRLRKAELRIERDVVTKQYKISSAQSRIDDLERQLLFLERM